MQPRGNDTPSPCRCPRRGGPGAPVSRSLFPSSHPTPSAPHPTPTAPAPSPAGLAPLPHIRRWRSWAPRAAPASRLVLRRLEPELTLHCLRASSPRLAAPRCLPRVPGAEFTTLVPLQGPTPLEVFSNSTHRKPPTLFWYPTPLPTLITLPYPASESRATGTLMFSL